MKRPVALLLTTALVMATAVVPTAVSALTSSKSVIASDDTYVVSSARTSNYASSSTLRVDASPVMKSYLKFTLPTISGAITNATLRLTPAASVNAAFDLRGVGSSAWTERSVTYATAPAVGKSIAHSSAALRSGVPVSFNVTSAIRSGLRSFALTNLGSTSTIQINSSEATTTSRRPTLILTISAPTPPGPCGAAPTSAPATAPIQHVIWIFMENHGYSQVVGSASAPFVNLLAAQCGLATNYHAITHPSLPNYIAATSGGTQGVTDDAGPSAHPLDVPSIFSQVRDAGLEWRSYQESAPANCTLSPSSPYAVKHDPAAYYTGLRDDCAMWDVPMGTTSAGHFLSDLNSNALPAFSFVTPNLCNDTHDCSIATGDAWLKAWFARIVASPGYLDGSTVVFLTWDEDAGADGNRVPTVVVSPKTPLGTVSTTLFSHYSLLKTAEELLGIPSFLGHAADAGTNSMRTAFHL